MRTSLLDLQYRAVRAQRVVYRHLPSAAQRYISERMRMQGTQGLLDSRHAARQAETFLSWQQSLEKLDYCRRLAKAHQTMRDVGDLCQVPAPLRPYLGMPMADGLSPANIARFNREASTGQGLA